MKHTFISGLISAALILMPFAAQADILSLVPLAPLSSASTGPLSCIELHTTLKVGSKNYEVRGLQYALTREGAVIASTEYGTFGSDTLTAVKAFQTKYAADILKDGSAPTGLVGKLTRAKLNAVYGCTVAQAMPATVPTSVVLNVKNVSLDSNGVTAVFCNQSPTDIPAFPVRVRLNGIIRDFNDTAATKAGTCDTVTIPYATWGLTYDAGTTFGVVTALDPNAMYKTAQVTYPLTGTTTLAIPAIQGAHLSVRGIALKSAGVQATLCNLGTSDLATYPVRVTVNGTSNDVDVAAAHAHGQCTSVTWPFSSFGIVNPIAGTIINATVNVDPNNLIQESNEFDNSATVAGSI